jgi:hypothetical protein
MKLLHRKSK